MDVGNMREEYREGELNREDMASDPFRQFDLWFKEALAKPEISEANAMTLATAGADGRVTARTVLLKAWDEKGFVFFTNYHSVKGQQIAENDQVALLFPWLPLERQVSVSGRAEKIAAAESLAYFSSRPFTSRLGAWVSDQSSIVTSRKLLEMKFEEVRQKYANGDVPIPDFWGGYRVRPETVEFWQGRTSRLHDRFLYTRKDENDWSLDRLSP
jgi:pyridoxamine 5'-phosphate oxidase